MGELAAWVDYPEEDLPAVEENALRKSLEDALAVTGRLLRDYDNGMLIRSGIDTVIAGKPNVGKSTLMNLLLGYDRSIVTDVAGTTRDVIEESAKLGELVFRLSDTAGIRDTEDTVEKVGVELAHKRLEECMFVIEVFDTSRKPDEDDIALLEKVKSLDKRCLIVLNKSDLESAVGEEFFREYSENIVCISAKNQDDRMMIQEAVEKIFSPENYDASSTIFANERQKHCAEKAHEHLNAALDSLNMGETLDAVTVMIDYAANALLELTGEKATEAVVSEVFSKFCVGK